MNDGHIILNTKEYNFTGKQYPPQKLECWRIKHEDHIVFRGVVLVNIYESILFNLLYLWQSTDY